MSRIEFVPVLLTNKADVFSIRLDNEPDTEFQKFYIQFKNTDDTYLADDLNRILAAINDIGQKGPLENNLKPEGHIYDRVCALPLLTLPRDKKAHGTLRLYCIRVSDKLFILGGGGLKTTQSYEEDEVLMGQVTLLQKIDKELWGLENDGQNIEQDIYNLSLEII